MALLKRDQWCIIVYRSAEDVVQIVGPFKSRTEALTEKSKLNRNYYASVTRMDTEVWK